MEGEFQKVNQPIPTLMKALSNRCIAFTSVMFIALASSQAGEAGSQAGGKAKMSVVEEKPKYQLQPIFTHLASISEKVTFSTTVRGSRSVEVQEAANLSSWGFDAELVVPLFKRFQLRLAAPVYTNGHARTLPVPVTGKGGRIVTQKVENIKLSGYGGVFDFGSVQLDGQFLTQEQHGINMTASVGMAKMLDPLRTNSVGRYNHAGEYYMLQLRADRKVNEWLTLVGHLGGRHYYISDDINPAGQSDGDVFTHFEAYAAGVFNPWDSNIFPVFEIAYTGDLDHYNAVLAVPEIIWAVNSHFELKIAVPLGVCDNGERVGFRVQATVRF